MTTLALLAATVAAASCGGSSSSAKSRATTSSSEAPITGSPAGTGATLPGTAPARSTPLFAHYYLWWADAHWKSRLGPSYPYTQQPPPLPSTLAANGCTAQASYPGAQLVDVPAPPLSLYSQDDAATIRAHVEEASSAGVDGFVVSWSGTGEPDQNTTSRDFNHRLDLLVAAVNAHNASGARRFSLMLGYETLDNGRNPRPATTIRNDLNYFVQHYATDPAFQVPRYGTKAVAMILDSRRIPTSELRDLMQPLRASLTLIGDEHGATEWQRGVADFFDGDGWYWSAENPYTNAHASSTLTKLSAILHGEHKIWFAPLSPGYNKSNFGVGGTCVPRDGTTTLRTIFDTNAASRPDGWMLISWNEFFENTYVEPSVRYGDAYLNAIRSLHT
ncbi:MAG: hypothetical protein JOZ99_06260 [Actinobacteria bacterium]|nr:hypothetical protein [Actinomycetota bacterium]